MPFIYDIHNHIKENWAKLRKMRAYLIAITFYSSVFFLLTVQGGKKQSSHFSFNKPDRGISST